MGFLCKSILQYWVSVFEYAMCYVWIFVGSHGFYFSFVIISAVIVSINISTITTAISIGILTSGTNIVFVFIDHSCAYILVGLWTHRGHHTRLGGGCVKQHCFAVPASVPDELVAGRVRQRMGLAPDELTTG